MATANVKTAPRSGAVEVVKPTSLAEHQAQHRAREGAIRSDCVAECEKLDHAKTRALAAEQKALAVAAAEYEAETLKRHEAAMAVVWGALTPRVERHLVERTHDSAAAVAEAYREAEAHLLHVEGRKLDRELGIVFAKVFAARVPESIEILGQLDVWTGGWGGPEGIPAVLIAASATLRNEHAYADYLPALLRLESAIAKRASLPVGGRLTPEDAPRHWAIVSACNPLTEEDAFKKIAAEAKEKAIADLRSEQDLSLRAVKGDPDARRKLADRGPGVLEATLRLAETILGWTGEKMPD